MDYMSLAHEMIVSMTTQFMFLSIALITAPVAVIVTYQINRARARTHQLALTQANNQHEINKLIEQRKMMDMRVIEGTHKRLGETQRE